MSKSRTIFVLVIAFVAGWEARCAEPAPATLLFAGSSSTDWNDLPRKTSAGIDLAAGRQFWSFRPVRNQELPAIKDLAWPRTDSDRFLLAVSERGFKFHMHDLHARILHLLGLNHELLTYRYAGRDFRLSDVYGRVVREGLA